MARRNILGATEPRHLRWFLSALFIGLAVPAAILIFQGFKQLNFESFRQQQLIAEEVAARIDNELAAALNVEEIRPLADYEFAIDTGDGSRNVLQRSPLSNQLVSDSIPGTLGYFQVDSQGRLTTPLLPSDAFDPASFGIEIAEQQGRIAVEQALVDVLAVNRLVRNQESPSIQESADQPAPQSSTLEAAATLQQEADFSVRSNDQQSNTAPARQVSNDLDSDDVIGQARFDQLVVNAVNAGSRTAGRSAPASSPTPNIERETAAEAVIGADSDARQNQRLRSELTDSSGAIDSIEDEEVEKTSTTPTESFRRDATVRVETFENDLEPLQFSRLDTGHFVLFRNAWRAGERLIQGLLIDQQAFLDGAVATAFSSSGFAAGTVLTVTTGSEQLLQASVANTGERDGRLLHAARLSPPLADIELAFTAGELPRGPTYSLLVWTAIVLFSVLVGGFFVMYRFSMQQIRLARQQRNFVSAVSHELKTPLTSIRMYGEILKSGWASEEKKQTYYDFIFAEGERLSRLIDNVLQLARLNRNGPAVSLEPMSVNEILDMVRSKVATQVEQAEFKLTLDIDEKLADSSVLVDADALTQVFINLVDNAIKFSGGAERREIALSARSMDGDRIVFCLRDFGPGIPQTDMKRLFELFYRPDNELTRTTSGTGIGLALVQQLVAAMHGRVDLRNSDPGAEFRLIFPRIDDQRN